jgi:hypothetical protein
MYLSRKHGQRFALVNLPARHGIAASWDMTILDHRIGWKNHPIDLGVGNLHWDVIEESVDIRYCIAWLFESWPSKNLIRGLWSSVFGSAF